MSQRSHAEIEETLGAYALDAVDADDRLVIDRHLRICRFCRLEVAGHQEVASFFVAPTGPAPAGLWDRIASAFEDPPPPLALAPVVSLTRRRATGMRLVAGVVAVAAVAAAVVGIRVDTQGRHLPQVRTARAEDLPGRAALAALANPDARTITLRGAGTPAAARVALLPDGQGYLVVDALPDLPSDRTYQLWALVNGERISGGTLGSRPEVAAFHVAGPVAGFAITEEQAEGAVASTNHPVLIGWLQQA